MSSLHSGLRYGGRRLFQILRPQQHASPVSCTGRHTAAATWEWRRQEAELSRRREQQQAREFLTVADSKQRWTGSSVRHHVLPPAAAERQATSFFCAAPEAGVKESSFGSSSTTTRDGKVPSGGGGEEEKVEGEAVGSPAEGNAAQANNNKSKDGPTPKVAQVHQSKDSIIDDLRDQLEDVEEALQKAQKSVKEMEDKMLRNLANAQNMVERSKREAESGRKFAVQVFAKDLLDVADNLSRAAAAVPRGSGDSQIANDEASSHLQALLQGVEMTEKQLLQAFKKHGLEKDDPVGQKFDPNFHSAVFEADDESKEAGTVAVVLKAGYKLHDRVIRPANVGVVKVRAEAEVEAQAEGESK